MVTSVRSCKAVCRPMQFRYSSAHHLHVLCGQRAHGLPVRITEQRKRSSSLRRGENAKKISVSARQRMGHGDQLLMEIRQQIQLEPDVAVALYPVLTAT